MSPEQQFKKRMKREVPRVTLIRNPDRGGIPDFTYCMRFLSEPLRDVFMEKLDYKFCNDRFRFIEVKIRRTMKNPSKHLFNEKQKDFITTNRNTLLAFYGKDKEWRMYDAYEVITRTSKRAYFRL